MRETHVTELLVGHKSRSLVLLNSYQKPVHFPLYIHYTILLFNSTWPLRMPTYIPTPYMIHHSLKKPNLSLNHIVKIKNIKLFFNLNLSLNYY